MSDDLVKRRTDFEAAVARYRPKTKPKERGPMLQQTLLLISRGYQQAEAAREAGLAPSHVANAAYSDRAYGFLRDAARALAELERKAALERTNQRSREVRSQQRQEGLRKLAKWTKEQLYD